ncbi:ly6/PLAUR domain-containing protein 3 [Camarhynchus parvulus]|uniref:ly6/PLAUR domain-containing protein 3 n=1 Tax=Geospiza parvula TaxID=87175 RepID=UPI001237F41E|nr:ly6/PLAUR domain-containing protein 3 [Camarhynchus parvulus]
MGGARPLLLLLLLLLPGSLGLRCLGCREDDDGGDGGSCGDVTDVTCPDSDVCGEALAAVTWSHGQLTLGWRGCGRGEPGSLARALTLPGLVAFVRRRNCRGEACNEELPLGGPQEPPPTANSSAPSPNGVRCYGCPAAGPCPPTAIVHCYGDLRACFHGNVTLRAGNVTLWRELRGCVPEGDCAPERQRRRRRRPGRLLLPRRPLQRQDGRQELVLARSAPAGAAAARPRPHGPARQRHGGRGREKRHPRQDGRHCRRWWWWWQYGRR